jgi:hypothetical protein
LFKKTELRLAETEIFSSIRIYMNQKEKKYLGFFSWKSEKRGMGKVKERKRRE